MSKLERWDGGTIHIQKDGRRLYIIERRRGGQRFHISTRCHTATAAHEHLKRFEADPWGYAQEMREGREPDGGITLTDELILDFRRWQLARVTRKHANEMAHRLSEWARDLGGRDLRRLELGLLKAKLAERKTGRQHRIIALKSLCAWLREEKHVLDRKDDVTLDLAVPQAVPEKHKRRKAVDRERVQAALGLLAPAYQDLLLLFGATGWHVTEMERFIREPESEVVHAKRGGVLAVLVTRHKNRKHTRTPITSAEALAAAERLRARGTMPRRPNAALRRACLAAGVEPFTFGVMRHTVGTWAVEEGALPETVSAFLDHADKSTSQRFYIDVAVPTATVPLPALRVVRREGA